MEGPRSRGKGRGDRTKRKSGKTCCCPLAASKVAGLTPPCADPRAGVVRERWRPEMLRRNSQPGRRLGAAEAGGTGADRGLFYPGSPVGRALGAIAPISVSPAQQPKTLARVRRDGM